MAVLGLLCCADFSLIVRQRAAFYCIAWASVLGGFSCCRTLGQVSLSSCGCQVYLPHGTWDLPISGIKPESPASASGFSTTSISALAICCYLLQKKGTRFYCGIKDPSLLSFFALRCGPYASMIMVF